MRKYLFLLLLMLLFLLPLLVVVGYSISSSWYFPRVFPSAIALRALRFVLGQLLPLARSLLSSLAYSFLSVLLAFLLCLLPASVLARVEFRSKALLEALLLAPALVPSITFSMGVHYFFIRIGLADTLAGIVLVLTIFSYPYMLRALIAGYLAYGEEYETCAKNLGAGLWMRLLRVDLPLLLPSIVAGGSVVFLITFSEYFLVFLIGGGAVPSFTGYLFPFLNSSDRSIASLLTLIFLLIPIMLFFIIDLSLNRAYRRRGML